MHFLCLRHPEYNPSSWQGLLGPLGSVLPASPTSGPKLSLWSPSPAMLRGLLWGLGDRCCLCLEPLSLQMLIEMRPQLNATSSR